MFYNINYSDIYPLLFIIIFMYILSYILYYLNLKLNIYKNNIKNIKTGDIFEYGSTTVGTNFSINNNNFFILSLLFILFDIELIYLYPFILNIIYNFNYISIVWMLIFIIFVILGIIFEIKNSILNFYTNYL